MSVKTGGLLVFLGPGRSGTTSLYHAFRSTPGYIVDSSKESGAISYAFSTREQIIRNGMASGVFVELTPSNLLAADLVIQNVRILAPKFYSFILIDRPVKERIWSLYLHHRKLGTIYCSFNDYVRYSAQVASTWKNSYSGSQDLTYAGLVEYNPSRIQILPDSTVVLNFRSLFKDLNEHLGELCLPHVKEVKRNEGFIPRSSMLHLIALKAYKWFGMSAWPGMQQVKKAYRILNSQAANETCDPDVYNILQEKQYLWMESLRRFRHISNLNP